MRLSVSMTDTPAAGQTREILAVCLASVAWGLFAFALISVAVVAAYIVKCKLGINLLPGPSPLQGLYLLIR